MTSSKKHFGILARVRVIEVVLFLIFLIFTFRLFYLQILRGSYYSKLAIANQQKQYEIAPERGTLYARDGDRTVPLVLNEKRYRLVADPTLIKKIEQTADALKSYSDYSEIKKQLENKDLRYTVLAKKLTEVQASEIRKLELAGVFLEETSQRIYPQGSLAASLLGFVNDEAEGKYGVEQALNDRLKGTPGKVKAITDHNGVPLLANGDNIETPSVDGEEVVLSIDVGMQQQVEEILKNGLANANSKSGGLIVMRPDNGEVVAMASYPTYDPAKIEEQKDPSVFVNSNVASPYEVGSVMKPLTVAAALNSGVVNANTTFYDPGYVIADGKTITNVEEDGGAGTRTLELIITMSLNTGASQMLKYMGGGDFTKAGREKWHDYLVNHYRFGQKTGIEQGYEEGGIVPDPNEGFGLNIRYANTTFGQGTSQTPIQMAAAFSALVNGGTYYQPTLVHATKQADGSLKPHQPTVLARDVLSPSDSQQVTGYMQTLVERFYSAAARPGYRVGGKTGTAQIADPNGGYYADRFNGSFVGFIGGDKIEYVVYVRVDDPKVQGYAGLKAAGPIFVTTAQMLLNNFNIQPKTAK